MNKGHDSQSSYLWQNKVIVYEKDSGEFVVSLDLKFDSFIIFVFLGNVLSIIILICTEYFVL